MLIPSLIAVVALILIHVFAHTLKFLEGTPRSRWLSAAGGISLAYVFLHLLPELAEGQALLAEEGLGVSAIEFEVYGLALVGLLAFYGIERYVQEKEEVGREDIDRAVASGVPMNDIEDPSEHPSFWLHLATFGLYNAVIGYLLVHRGGEESHGEASGHGTEVGHGADAALAEGGLASGGELTGLATFAIAMALHFLVTDYGLREDFRQGWRKQGRWILSAALVVGWLLGLTTELPEIAVLGLIALLGGGVILNVLKEELPEERQSRFGALLLGAVGYAALLAFAH